MIPAVRKPYCAGSAPVISDTELASRVCKRLAEDVDPLGQDDAVEAELQIGVVAADMQLAERILGDARRLQQQSVERLIVALRLRFDRLPAEIVDAGAEARLDLAARDVELSWRRRRDRATRRPRTAIPPAQAGGARAVRKMGSSGRRWPQRRRQ